MTSIRDVSSIGGIKKQCHVEPGGGLVDLFLGRRRDRSAGMRLDGTRHIMRP